MSPSDRSAGREAGAGGPRRAGDAPAPADAASPELSVITVTHGRRALVVHKAEALARQSLPAERFEWRVLANGDPEAADALRALELPFRTVVLESDANLPIAAARNRAAADARSPLLLMSDDDVLPGPSCLSVHLEAQRAHPGSVMVGALRLPESLRAGRRREPFERAAAVAGRALWINATGANTSLPRALFERVGGYDERYVLYGGEDPDLAWRLRAEGVRFRYLPGAWAHHVGRILGADDRKAALAGHAHYLLYRRTGAAEVGWLLGVHPWMLAAKRLWWRGPWRRMLPRDLVTYETAYLEGALRARRGAPATPEPEPEPERGAA